MALVTIGSVRGAPGVTTLGVALARTWVQATGCRGVLLEADPDGGVLAARSGRHASGLRELAAQARSRFPAALLETHVTELPGPAAVVLAPADAELAIHAVHGLAPLTYAFRELPGTDVIADIGRYRPDTPAAGLLEAADLRVVVLRGEECELQAAAALGPLPGHGRTAAVLVGGNDERSAMVARRIGLRVLGRVPHDRRGAAAVLTPKRRSRLLRHAVLVGAVVGAQVPRS